MIMIMMAHSISFLRHFFFLSSYITPIHILFYVLPPCCPCFIMQRLQYFLTLIHFLLLNFRPFPSLHYILPLNSTINLIIRLSLFPRFFPHSPLCLHSVPHSSFTFHSSSTLFIWKKIRGFRILFMMCLQMKVLPRMLLTIVITHKDTKGMSCPFKSLSQ